MEDKVAVVTDSIACLTNELVQKYRIEIVPIRLLVQGKVYRDALDITPSEAYELFLQDPESFTTSPDTLTPWQRWSYQVRRRTRRHIRQHER